LPFKQTALTNWWLQKKLWQIENLEKEPPKWSRLVIQGIDRW
jgi:hypothetical protein